MKASNPRIGAYLQLSRFKVAVAELAYFLRISVVRDRNIPLRSLLLMSSLYVGFLAPSQAQDPTYRYEIEVNNDRPLCRHMNGVFNRDFANLWNVIDEAFLGDLSVFSETSKYKFPVFPGTEHDPLMTNDMIYSKFPSSTEFEAVVWKEGRRSPTTPGVGNIYASGQLPVLVANVDLNNDGQLDTIMKYAFTGSYRSFTNSRGPVFEYLMIWPSYVLDFHNGETIETLRTNYGDKEPFTIGGMQVRIFIYKGKTYMAEYVVDAGEDGALLSTPPYVPRETMIVSLYRDALNSETSPNSAGWISDLRCRFQMKQR